MHMPETAVHKNDFSTSPEHHVWPGAAQPDMQPVPIPVSMQQATHDEFGLGVLLPDRRHVAPALCLGVNIHKQVRLIR
jgi:hypothetical protein